VTIWLSIGRYGGFYVSKGYMFRICLGWIAITFAPFDVDEVLLREIDKNRGRRGRD
jgi:hypothetical protein